MRDLNSKSRWVGRGVRFAAMSATWCLAVVAFPRFAHAVTVDVNTAVDEFSATNNGLCSLREAFKALQDNVAFGGCPAGGSSVNDAIHLTTDVTLTANQVINVVSPILIYTDYPGRYTITGDTSSFFSVKSSGFLSLSRVKLTGFKVAPLVLVNWMSGPRPEAYLEQVEISNNAVIESSNSAAIQVGTNSYLTVKGGIFYNNTQAIRGAGLLNFGNATLRDVTFAENSASQFGGGIANFGTMKVVNATITQNKLVSTTSGSGGGGIYNSPGATLDLWHSTVVQNSTKLGFGNGVLNAGTLRIWTTIVADNGSDCQGGLTSLGYNYSTNCAALTGSNDVSSAPALNLLALEAISPGWHTPPRRRAPAQGSPVVSKVPQASCDPASRPDMSNQFDPAGIFRFTSNSFCDVGAAESYL